jgi:cytochrome c oxidase subunit IV
VVLLFVLSAASYAVDVSGLEGLVKWSLIVLFMLLKAGLIVAVFMHMVWERLALSYAIVLPPLVMLVFVAIMAFESEYVLFTDLADGRPLQYRRAQAGMVKWYHESLPSSRCGFDSRYPLQDPPDASPALEPCHAARPHGDPPLCRRGDVGHAIATRRSMPYIMHS